MSRPGGRRAAAPLIKDPQRYKARRRPPAGARAALAPPRLQTPHTRRRARQTELCSTYSRTGGCLWPQVPVRPRSRGPAPETGRRRTGQSLAPRRGAAQPRPATAALGTRRRPRPADPRPAPRAPPAAPTPRRPPRAAPQDQPVALQDEGVPSYSHRPLPAGPRCRFLHGDVFEAQQLAMLRLAGRGRRTATASDGSPGGAAGPSGSQPTAAAASPTSRTSSRTSASSRARCRRAPSARRRRGRGFAGAPPPRRGAARRAEPGAAAAPARAAPGMLPASVASSSLTGSSLAGSVHASPPQPALPAAGRAAACRRSARGCLGATRAAPVARPAAAAAEPAGGARAVGGAAGAGAAAAAQRGAVGAAAAVVGRRGSSGDPATDAELAMLPLPGHLPSSSFAPPPAVGAYSSPGRTSLDSARSLSPRSVQSSATPSVLSPSLIPIGATASTAAACSPFALPPALPDGAAPQHHYARRRRCRRRSLSSAGPPSSHTRMPRLAPTGAAPRAGGAARAP